jgi:hypothetical protein
MKFAIMVWTSGNVRSGSIFGVLDAENPGTLPQGLSKAGHWADYRTVDESRCPFADEAKKAIAAQGYYLMGAGVSVEAAFGSP